MEDLFYHVLAVLHDPNYRRENAGALRMEWPRIPLPGWPEFSATDLSRRGGSRTAPTVATHEDTSAEDPSVIPADAGIQEPAGTTQPGTTAAADPSVTPAKAGVHLPSDAARELAASAARGRQLARLLDSDTPVPGVTTGTLRPEIAAIAVPATTDDCNMTADDFALTAGWGHFGSGEAVMPGQGKVIERAYTPAEREALNHAQSASTNAAPAPEATKAVLGETTYDIYLNDRAYWRNVPANVWHYKLGGYQVLKKWLSYREQTVLGRPLKPEEVQHFTDTARRIGRMLTVVAEL